MTAKSENKPVFVAIDDGYSQMKVSTLNGGEVTTFSMPTSVRAGHEGISALDGSGSSGWYETEGQRFTAGIDIVGEASRSRTTSRPRRP